MKIATLYCDGDRSVGISGHEITIDISQLCLDEVDAVDCREPWRKQIVEFFSNLTDEKYGLMWDDECGCGRVKQHKDMSMCENCKEVEDMLEQEDLEHND